MISAVLNKIRKGDPDNVTRWSDVVQKNTDTNLNKLEIPAVQFMIDLCLRRYQICFNSQALLMH